MTVRPCRVWTEGIAPGIEQVARDHRHLAGSVAADEARLRFHRYEPTASLGRHEAVCHGVRIAYCDQAGIPVVRRLTGGGALYLAPGQCCLSLTLPRRWLGEGDTLTALMARLNRALVRALVDLGIPAHTTFPNDLEVSGRKLGAGFLAIEAEAILYQAVILETLDTEVLLKVLRAPREKLSAQGILSARNRFITLGELPVTDPDMEALKAAAARSLLGELALTAIEGVPDLVQEQAQGSWPPPSVDPALDEDWSATADESWQAFLPTPGGILQLRLVPDDTGRMIRAAQFSGAVHVAPPDLFLSLAETLAGAPMAAAEVRMIRRLRAEDVQLPGFGPDELCRLLRLALGRRAEQGLGLSAGQANRLMVHRPGGVEEVKDILGRASVLLVPYCAKPAWCDWRHEDACPECGGCDVGEAYRLARERGMKVVTITRYEHLCQVLERMQAEGESAYVGMCCRDFYQKRIHAFRAAGIPAVLMDITGANCYDLNQEEAAYAGEFTAEAALDMGLVEKVMVWVPKKPAD
ncbi:lipoyl protein ligase domain-containing protein [Ectothiorhodospira lacustris]|uniref:lipoyl protein ligase domain-containing protein n=1 Tax=Ectothiorhodospira lacustris TaxID=2899127 RepID=UPI001EE974E6|nr:DUF116 domain-containing protein [Ectothiorhodospira lacustris]MCG5511379.1 DUF116 domain-containing protein [Ectothiorhodospira lacustris]MCG5523220.1 DUF116 domain-containing protein [Ectothiorhodospira lacustris]